jgi:hypothetical protein
MKVMIGMIGMIAIGCVAAWFAVCQISEATKIQSATRRLLLSQAYIDHLERLQRSGFTDARCEELRGLIREQNEDMEIK